MSASASLCDACTNPGRCCTGFDLPLAHWKETPLEALVVMATVNVGTTLDGRSLLLDPRPGLPRRKDLASAEVGLPFMPLSRKENGHWRWWCPHLVKGRCSIYEDRPTLCRQFEPGSDSLCCMPAPAPQENDMDTSDTAEVVQLPVPPPAAAAKPPWPGSYVTSSCRYLMFSGLTFSSAGGWRDFKQAFSDADTAIEAAEQIEDEWVQVVDLITVELVYERGDPAYHPTRNAFGPRPA